VVGLVPRQEQTSWGGLRVRDGERGRVGGESTSTWTQNRARWGGLEVRDGERGWGGLWV